MAIETKVGRSHPKNTGSSHIQESHSSPDGLLRWICLRLSNLILQFPVVFELQQRIFRQPGLLCSEVEEELSNMHHSGAAFKVLDYGCGSGTYSGLFSHKDYLGIDNNAAMIARASSQHPNHKFMIASNLSGIQSELEDVSHVLMIGVVHHLSDKDITAILSSLPKSRSVKLLTIDTLKCERGVGRFIQLFERGEYLRSQLDHRKLLARVADQISYKEVPYGNYFKLAIFRGTVKHHID